MQDWLGARWYSLAYGTCMAAMTVGWSFRFDGRRHVPPTGPALLVANHQSFIDPILICLASPRRLWTLARKTLYKNQFFGRLIDSVGSVPVDNKGVAKEGLRALLEQMELGRAVVVFPEGERTHDGTIGPLKPGIQLLLKRMPVPVLPVGVAGAFEAYSRHARLPRFSPLFLPATGAGLAVSIGAPLDGKRLAGLGREELLTELYGELVKVRAHAEKLRRA